LLRINQATAVALADTGSTDTFMDLKFAQTNNIPMTATKQRTVKVAGGGILTSTATLITVNSVYKVINSQQISKSWSYKVQILFWRLTGSSNTTLSPLISSRYNS
jgi:hypothetical protein